MSASRNHGTACAISPSYGGGTITSLPNRGGTIIEDSPFYEDLFLIDEFLNFIVTEANDKIIVGETEVGGKLSASITQLPKQGGPISQRP